MRNLAAWMIVGCGARTALPIDPGDASIGAPRDGGSTTPAPVPSACPRAFGRPQLVANVNTSFDDLCARLSPDEKTMWFTSDRGDSRPRPDGWELYVTTRAKTSDPFSVPTKLATLESNLEDGCPTVTGDGLRIFFQTRRTNGKLEIWSSTRSSTSVDFPAPSRVDALVPSGWETWNPYVLPDGSAIYHSGASSSGTHMHRAAAMGTSFGAPQPLLSLAMSQEQAPVVTQDERWIFYAQAGTMGGRDFDIYVSTRASTSVPFPTSTVVQELSTPGYEFATWISPDGCRMYFTSERAGGPGRDDIWMAER